MSSPFVGLIVDLAIRDLPEPLYCRLGPVTLRHDGVLIEVVDSREAPDAVPWVAGGAFDVPGDDDAPLDEPGLLALIDDLAHAMEDAR